MCGIPFGVHIAEIIIMRSGVQQNKKILSCGRDRRRFSLPVGELDGDHTARGMLDFNLNTSF